MIRAMVMVLSLSADVLAFRLAPTRSHSRRIVSESVLHLKRSDEENVAVAPDVASSRRDALRIAVAMAVCAAAAPVGVDGPASVFEGGVGGLGKTRPETGIVFRDPEAAAASSGSDSMAGFGGGSQATNELLAPDGTPALVTFYAPWPMLRSSLSVESRDLANPESAFILVKRVPGVGVGAGGLTKSFFSDAVFSQAGKYGAYGAPFDIGIKKLDPSSYTSAPGTVIYEAKFTTLTPAMRESDRRAYISASVVGDGAFLLVTSTTAPRFKKIEKELRRVADSFACAAAPP